MCPVPPIPDKAVITKCGNKAGDTCHFDCVLGYAMEQGTESRTCLANGQWGSNQVKCSGKSTLMCNELVQIGNYETEIFVLLFWIHMVLFLISIKVYK